VRLPEAVEEVIAGHGGDRPAAVGTAVEVVHDHRGRPIVQLAHSELAQGVCRRVRAKLRSHRQGLLCWNPFIAGAKSSGRS
jgi:hypothetical protein